MTRLLASAVLVLAVFAAQAQRPYFRQHTIVPAGTEINFVTHDREGLIWLGTDRGLLRYDGVEARTYAPPEDPRPQHTTAFYMDDSGERWVGYADGSIWLVRSDGRLEAWQPEEGLPKQRITGILQDSSQRLWLATYGEGLYVREDGRLYNFNMDDGLASNEIYDIALGPDGMIWAATDDGVNLCRFEAGAKQIEHLTGDQGLLDEIVYTLRSDEDGMWLGFEARGLCHYHTDRQVVDWHSAQWSGGPVVDLAYCPAGEVWIATEHEGLMRMSKTTGEVLPVLVDGLSEGDRLSGMVNDPETNLWLVTAAGKVLSGNRRIELLHHGQGDIQAICEDGQGRIWLGLPEGLCRLDGNQLVRETITDQMVISLYADELDNLWIGTFGQGVIKWNPEDGQVCRFAEQQGLANGSVLSIAGHRDQIWLATLGGITTIRDSLNGWEPWLMEIQNLTQDGEADASFLFSAFVDRRHRTWFGSDGRGVVRITEGQVTNLLDQEELLVRKAYCFAEDRRGDLWIGTADNGLFRYGAPHAQRYAIESGLRSNTILSLEVDRFDNIVVVHSQGIDLLHRDGWVEHLSEVADLAHFDPSTNTSFRTKDGSILVGGDNLIFKYRPLTDGHKTYPRVVLSDAKIFDQSVDIRSGLQLAHRSNFAQFDFTGIWLTNPKALSFEYMLVGNDPQSRSSKDNRVSYSRLSPGQYDLQVHARLHDQIIDASKISVPFRVLRPVWQRWWFMLLFISAVAWLILRYQRYREHEINKRERMRRERIESQFEVLKAQINPHFLFNSFNTLANLVEEDAGNAVEYIEKLSDYYRRIIQFRDQKLISLHEEISLIHDFRYLLHQRFGDKLKIHIDLHGVDGAVPPLCLQMLVENAVKHNIVSAAKPLLIQISANGDEYLEISNNIQEKINPAVSTKFGLQNIKSRYALLSDRKVFVERNQGTFVVRVPVIKTEKE